MECLKSRNFISILVCIIFAACQQDFIPTPVLGLNEDFAVINIAFPDANNSKINTSFRDSQTLLETGFNYNVALGNNIYLAAVVSLDSIDPNINYSPEFRNWIETNSESVRLEILDNKQAGLKCLGMTDILLIPKQLYDVHRTEMVENDKISLDKPFVQKLIRETVNELFNKFDLDGLIFRTGELYMNRLQFHHGESIIRNPQDYVTLIKILREEICVKRNKQLIFRTWGWDGFHVVPSFYLNVTNQIEPHKNLFFSMKYTSDDFLRTVGFNATIGIGNHKQIVEYQSQRETEGKGAHPNYIVNGVLTGFTESSSYLASLIQQRRIAGMFIWSRGGGWAGPQIENEFWCELNTYVMTQYIANEGVKTEEEIFDSFCKKVGIIDNVSIANFNKLCMLSEPAVLYGQYSTEYSINRWWTRDYCLGGMDQLKETFDEIIVDSKIDVAILEKEKAVDYWKEIVSLSNNIQSTDKSISDFIRISSLYGFYKYSIIKEGFTVMLLGYHGDKTNNYRTNEISQAIDSYDRLWNEYIELKENNLNCPGLYHPFSWSPHVNMDYLSTVGMKTSVDKYRYLKK